MPMQMVVGDRAVREVVRLQPMKFAAIELVAETSTHVPERLGGYMKDGVPTGGIAIPDLASFLTGFSADTKIVGMNSVPPSDRPPATIVHLAFDVMVFSASALMLLAVWFVFAWWRRRDLPRSPWFLRAAVVAAALSMMAMEAGWITTEVGRQPWVVYGVMRTAEAVTLAPGIWGSFALVVGLYTVVGVGLILVLRAMARRWREAGPEPLPGPYAPRGPLVLPPPRVASIREGRRMSTIAAVILWFAITCYAVLGGADYGAGFWDLTAGGAKRGARPRALIDQAMAPVWEANNVWLILALVVLWTAFPRAFEPIMSTLFVPMSLAGAGIVLRGSAFVFRKSIRALTGRRLFGAVFALSSVLTPFFLGAAFGAIASGRVQAGDPGGDPLSAWIGPTPMLIGALAVLCSAFLAAVFLVFDARRARRQALERYFRRRAIGCAAVTGVVALAGLFVLRRDAPFVFRRPHARGAALRAAIGRLRRRRHRAAGERDHAGHPGARRRRGRRRARGLGRGAVPVPAPDLADDRSGGGRARTLDWVLVVLLVATVTVVPALAFLFVLDQRGRLARARDGRSPASGAATSRALSLSPSPSRTGAAPPRIRPHWWERPTASVLEGRMPAIAGWYSLPPEAPTAVKTTQLRQHRGAGD